MNIIERIDKYLNENVNYKKGDKITIIGDRGNKTDIEKELTFVESQGNKIILKGDKKGGQYFSLIISSGMLYVQTMGGKPVMSLKNAQIKE